MADNYHIDKNSKLFQKFLNLKSKNSSEVQEAPKYQLPKREKPSQLDTSQSNQRATLHMSIDDIEEAASMVQEEQRSHIQQFTFNSKSEQAAQMRVPENQADQEDREADRTLHQEELHYQSVQPRIQTEEIEPTFEASKPERTERVRERRNRDFQSNKNREEPPTAKATQNRSSLSPAPRMTSHEFASKQDSIRKEKENIQLNHIQEEPSKPDQLTFTIGPRDHEYKKKFERLTQKYEQLKETTQQERKIRQKEIIERESELEIIKEKYYELRSNEDTLMTDNKRLKERLQSESMLRTKFEEEVKELTFKIQELEDMLQGKDGNLKKKSDEVGYWKSQHQNIRGQIKSLNSEIQKLEDRCQYLQSENKMVKKDITNKENLIEELRKNINNLIDENNIVKDEIYKLTIKLYHLQQENQMLKGDIVRRDKEQPHQMSIINENYRRNMESLSPKRPDRPERQERYERPDRIERQRPNRGERPDRQEKPERETVQPQGNRRRQFARERAVTTKPERPDRNEREGRHAAQPDRRMESSITNNNNHSAVNQNNAARIQAIEAELERRKELKVLNGKQRRQKIELERQLQQLLGK